MKLAGSRGALNHRCRIDIIRPMHGNSKSAPCECLLVMHRFWYLVSLIGLLRVMGVNLLIAFTVLGACIKVAGGQPC